ncbi:L-serine ammonia-lyase [Psychrobacter aestuarii]|uniref:L-serine dehydratase n=1 Tax=Psychrobacter aestuarii TaxID=556327 RepID=A0ABN0VWF4_9GAMM|nr:L-serine ammonia-lyase [Psychrobacter aestuarii]
MISIFDLFKIGIGPSSSHTVGPMVAAQQFLQTYSSLHALADIAAVDIDLYGSLAATGEGHATDTAILLGLLGHTPEHIDTRQCADYLRPIMDEQRLALAGEHVIDFDTKTHIHWHPDTVLPYHPNALSITATLGNGEVYTQTYYSIGGGFVINQNDATNPDSDPASPTVNNPPYPFNHAADLLTMCESEQLSISDVVLANELHYRSEEEVFAYLDRIWTVMQDCVSAGCMQDGILPGGLSVKRRAKALHEQLRYEASLPPKDEAGTDKLAAMDWVDLYALAVNEENANGGKIVTAPTNGAAGIIPAVMHYYRDFLPQYDIHGVRKFLLTAAAIGSLIKQNASISGAEVGCQGEVGSACAMAAAALAEIMGGTPAQCLNAAEIGIEHNLGLTCDPVAGLVQVPCIERNAMAAIKAINAARLAYRGDGQHFVSLDKVIETMKQTGADMSDKYKETARGGLAVYANTHIPTVQHGVSVNYSQC